MDQLAVGPLCSASAKPSVPESYVMAATQPQNGGGPPVSALQLIRARLFAAAQHWQAEYADARFSRPLRSAA